MIHVYIVINTMQWVYGIGIDAMNILSDKAERNEKKLLWPT